MVRARVLLLVALCAFSASGVYSSREGISPESIADVFQEFANSLEDVISGEGRAVPGRSLLQSSDPSVISRAESLLGNIPTYVTDVRAFLNRILGSTWAAFAPESWTAPDFSWSTLTSLANNFSSSTLEELYGDIKHKAIVPEKFVSEGKPDPVCFGPTVTLSYVPKVCVWPNKSKATDILCSPANITLTKNPAYCEVYFTKISHYTGKEILANITVGFTGSKAVGGKKYDVPVTSILKKAEAAKYALLAKKV